MPQVDHLRPGLLQYAADDIDGCIMPVEQAGCRDKSGSGYRPFVVRTHVPFSFAKGVRIYYIYVYVNVNYFFPYCQHRRKYAC